MSTAVPTPEGPPGTVPKWVVALAIGVPVAAALAYILFGPSTGDSAEAARSKKLKKAKTKTAAEMAPPAPKEAEPQEKEVEVENCPEEEVPTDPLERATAAKNRGTVGTFMYGSRMPKTGLL